MVVGLCSAFSQSNPSSATPASDTNAKPLLLEKKEGELRTRRIHTDNSDVASSQFMLKVSPKNNGSQHLVAGTEELAPGAAIRKHRHLTQDEILLMQGGKAHVWLGDQERDLHAGGLVFIPANTWISAKNVGTEPVSITFIFSLDSRRQCGEIPCRLVKRPLLSHRSSKRTVLTWAMPKARAGKKSPSNEQVSRLD